MCSSNNCFERILKLLRAIQENLNCHMNARARNCGLSTTEFMVMFEIYNKEGISLNELSKNLTLPKSSVSRIVDQLVSKEIVDRVIPAENRRTVKLSIRTDFLKSKEVKSMSAGFNERLLKTMGEEKTEQVISALEILKSIFTDEIEKV